MSKDLKARTRRDICTPMFIAALFTIAKRWKEPKCPSADEQINKIWSVTYNGILFSLEEEDSSVSCYSMDEP